MSANPQCAKAPLVRSNGGALRYRSVNYRRLSIVGLSAAGAAGILTAGRLARGVVFSALRAAARAEAFIGVAAAPRAALLTAETLVVITTGRRVLRLVAHVALLATRLGRGRRVVLLLAPLIVLFLFAPLLLRVLAALPALALLIALLSVHLSLLHR